MELIFHNLKHALMITSFVFVMMMIIDYINVLTAGKLNILIKGGRLRQYIVCAFLGAVPGCLGAFMVVSFYVRGMVSIGAVCACMIATAGDESFVMFSLFPQKALFIHLALFVVGVAGGFIVDKAMKRFKWKDPCECGECLLHLEDQQHQWQWREIFSFFKKLSLSRFSLIAFFSLLLYSAAAGMGFEEGGWEKVSFIFLMAIALFVVVTVSEHYLIEHIWEHIVKRHLWRILLWSFCAFFLIDLGLNFFNLESFVRSNMIYVLLLAALIGLIPESGPHLIFVMMFYKGLVPFSVLFTSCIVSDGHGIIPLLSHSVKASVWVKLFNLVIGLIIGYSLYFLGV